MRRAGARCAAVCLRPARTNLALVLVGVGVGVGVQLVALVGITTVAKRRRTIQDSYRRRCRRLRTTRARCPSAGHDTRTLACRTSPQRPWLQRTNNTLQARWLKPCFHHTYRPCQWLG